MSRIDLQPATAQTGITAAQGAGSVQAAATVASGPISTGALSIIDAAAGIAELVAVTAEKCRAIAVLTSTNATGTAATLAVSVMEAIDEANAQQLKAAGPGL